MSSVDAGLLAIDDYANLATDWSALEAVADGSPFTAWPWVSAWLRHLPASVRVSVFRATDADGVLALGLLVDTAQSGLRRLVRGRSMLMQETGLADIDEITIEYAGLLTRSGDEARAYAALFDTLKRALHWQSLTISASLHARAVMLALPNAMRAFSVHEHPSHFVDLASVRASGGDYVSMLSSNTRSSLRRTRRAYEAHGEIRAEIAADGEQALEWLGELRTLHERHWRSKGKRGSFGSAFFTAFHTDFVRENAKNGCVHLMRVTAGSLVVGYLYNLHWRNRVYFYNGGLNYGALERHDRPGYLAHLAAIEKYVADGFHSYDFLAGEGDYKRAMSTHKRMLNWILVKRSGLRLAGESAVAVLFGKRRTSAPMSAAASSDPVLLSD